MPKHYRSLKVEVEIYRKIIKARGKLEYKTGERCTIDNVLEKALDGLLSS